MTAMENSKIARAVRSQYLAALKMLRQAIVKCPPSLWNSPRDKDRLWFKAYHTIVWTHRYLQDKPREFRAWKGYSHPNDCRGHGTPKGVAVVSRDDLLEYLDFLESHLSERLRSTAFSAPTGFVGFPMDKLEMHMLQLRHIQQHVGEIYERLGSRAGLQLTWSQQAHKETP
jgi:hypothetical protein